MNTGNGMRFLVDFNRNLLVLGPCLRFINNTTRGTGIGDSYANLKFETYLVKERLQPFEKNLKDEWRFSSPSYQFFTTVND